MIHDLLRISVIFIGVIWVLGYLIKRKSSLKGKMIRIGIFHPHCDSGGGGERVLWMIIAGILQNSVLASSVELIVYCSDQTESKEIVLQNVQNKFHIAIPPDIHSKITFIKIPSCDLLDGSRYPHFTMLFQILAMIYLSTLCARSILPDIFLDTTGAPFMFPLFKLCQCKVAAYIHYPLLSTDMLRRVRDMRPSYNNNQRIASSQSVSALKLVYYRFLGFLYSLTGYCVDLAFVNSSWTEQHMKEMWDSSIKFSAASSWRCGPKKLIKLFPPCNTQHLRDIPLGLTSDLDGCRKDLETIRIGRGISYLLANLDPKRTIRYNCCKIKDPNYAEINRSFSRFLKDNPEEKYQNVRLIILGSCRNSDDEKLLTSLKHLADSLQISSKVDFVVNAPFARLKSLLGESSIGLHTMWNEHFGISIVEMMAAGLVVIAHNSGGPAMDIIQPSGPSQTGFLAQNEVEYATCMKDALDKLEDNEGSLSLRSRGRESTSRFSDEEFVVSLNEHLSTFVAQYWNE